MILINADPFVHLPLSLSPTLPKVWCVERVLISQLSSWSFHPILQVVSRSLLH
jgi:hypothetical protein